MVSPRAEAQESISSRRPKRTLVLLKAAVSLLFLIVVFRFVGSADFLDTLSRLDLRFAALSALVSVTMILLSCLKWQILISIQGRQAPFLVLLRYYLIGYYFSNLMPSNVGGDIVRAYFAGRYINSYSRAAVSVFLERFTGLILLLVLVILGPLLYPELLTRGSVLIPMGLAGLLLLFLLFSAVFFPLLAPAAARFPGLFPSYRELDASGRQQGLRHRLQLLLGKVFGMLQKFSDKLFTAIRTLIASPRQAVAVLLTTVGFYLLTFANVYVSYLTFDVEPSLFAIMAMVPVAMLISMLPIALGGIGLAEGAFVFYLGLAGMDPSDTLAMALLLRLKLIIIGLFGLHFALKNEND